MEYENCPCCGKKIQTKGLFGLNALYYDDLEFINIFNGNNFPAYCEACKSVNFNNASKKFLTELKENQQIQNENIGEVPCINIPSPITWNYDVLEIVTGQSTMGTGFVSELSSGWNDLFGLESRTMNSKISAGEDNCMKMLRAKAIGLGGNAVIGIDIDYAEVGSLRGMIMVCATGTAVRVKNLEVFSEAKIESLKKLQTSFERMKILNKYKNVANYLA
ncbi:YbjQ family protein [Emticicia fontis]